MVTIAQGTVIGPLAKNPTQNGNRFPDYVGETALVRALGGRREGGRGGKKYQLIYKSLRLTSGIEAQYVFVQRHGETLGGQTDRWEDRRTGQHVKPVKYQ